MPAARVAPLLAALLLLLSPAAAPAAAQGAAPLELGPHEVEPGMTGYAITAANDDELERFDIEVLGVLEGAANGFPLILVRASGALMEATGGVAAGMSGSPAYVRTPRGPALLGAIGYVFPGALDTVALVTPIGEMRRVHDAKDWLGAELPQLADYGAAVPVATPLLLPGASERAASLLSPLFEGAPTVPVAAQAGGSGAPVTAPKELRPGSAVAISLITGDASLAAVGTVTAVEDGRVLAFGHPLLGYGKVSLPLTPASIVSIVPSRDVPFKLANVAQGTLGVVNQDRPAAVAGTLHDTADMLTVNLAVLGVPGAPRYEFMVPKDERLYPTLVAVGTLELLDRVLGATAAGHAEIAWEVELARGETVNVIEQVNDGGDIAFAAARLAGGPLAVLASNPFRAAAPERVSMSARISPRQRFATLEEAVLENRTVEEGGTAHVHVRLQPFRENAAVRTITVPLPDGVTGDVTLLLRGGSVPRDTGESHLDEKDIDAPRSFGELLDALRHRVQASELVVEAIAGDGDVLRLSRESYPYVVLGSQRVEVSVTPRETDPAPKAPEGEQREDPGE